MRDDLNTWREMISEALSEAGETWADVESATLTDTELDTPFDGGFGGTEGATFTIWTAKRVYFPACYDGAEWCDSVSRHPDGKKTDHIGGG